ncbi:selenocysteine-specific translation elongation factor [Candidatus Solincola tengchongensis]|uniref:selenocysteine-specific translation elongation factor n=1 Tax=Candidatus Solincola tengchongensis TaxID=2900693 RepID=UPI00257E2E25|nr:selenocysteine-specific translation elongation factor [Candidatus Solincola tengchongensis]
MKNFIIGTAGHIDHGKTELVKALTGTDTDRLKEEKERGISIELGFAELKLPNGTTAGVVDVPGHEHFVKNMLAGATGFDMVLLVVAADDGVMPQTVEHLAIVDLLGVSDGVVAITKADLVEEDMLELVREDVGEALRGTVLEGAEVVVTSSRTGEGLDELLQALSRAAERVRARDSEGPFRLPVDRVFTLRGIGTVVTGTLWEGSVADGEEAVVQPRGKPVRVRNVQVHGEEVERAYAGQRVAMNLPGISKEEIARGDVIVSPGHLRPTLMADASLHLLHSAPQPLRNRARVRFHHGTSEIMARVVLLGGREELPPGESHPVQLRLERPAVLRYGDRFIIRSYSPITTIGGGRILDSHPRKHRHHQMEVLEELEVRGRGDPAELLLLALEERGLPMSLAALVERLELKPGDVEGAVRELVAQGRLVEITGESGPLYLSPSLLSDLLDTMVRLVEELHAANPLKAGVEKEVLRQRLGERVVKGRNSQLPAEEFLALLRAAEKESRLETEGGKIRVKGKGRALGERERALLEDLNALIREGGFSPPLFKELGERLGLDRNRLRDLLNILLEEGRIEQVNPEYYLAAGKLAEAEEKVLAFLAERERLSVADLRDMLGASRKYAIPLLEYMDRKRITRREGDFRVSFKSGRR